MLGRLIYISPVADACTVKDGAAVEKQIPHRETFNTLSLLRCQLWLQNLSCLKVIDFSLFEWNVIWPWHLRAMAQGRQSAEGPAPERSYLADTGLRSYLRD